MKFCVATYYLIKCFSIFQLTHNPFITFASCLIRTTDSTQRLMFMSTNKDQADIIETFFEEKHLFVIM